MTQKKQRSVFSDGLSENAGVREWLRDDQYRPRTPATETLPNPNDSRAVKIAIEMLSKARRDPRPMPPGYIEALEAALAKLRAEETKDEPSSPAPKGL